MDRLWAWGGHVFYKEVLGIRRDSTIGCRRGAGLTEALSLNLVILKARGDIFSDLSMEKSGERWSDWQTSRRHGVTNCLERRQAVGSLKGLCEHLLQETKG